VYKSEN